MRKYAVIVAGGSGSRMGGGIPKQFRSLKGKPLLWWSLRAFYNENRATTLILVLPEDFIDLWKDFFEMLPEELRFPHKITKGGKTRTESVINGLALIDEIDSLVAVHDAARPFIDSNIILSGWKTAEEKGAAVPVVAITDSLRKKNDTGSKAVDRSDYYAVQTPQVFKTKILKESYENLAGEIFSDDATAVESNGHEVFLFEGKPENIKVTNPRDMEIAEILMNRND